MNYARIDEGTVVEIFEPVQNEDGVLIPIEQRFHADFVASLVPIPQEAHVDLGNVWDGLNFSLPSAPAPSNAAEEARARRNQLLILSDWTQLPDVPETLRSKWAEYRQALRNVPQQAKFPDKVKWPEAPQ